jgi:hypothetical protein
MKTLLVATVIALASTAAGAATLYNSPDAGLSAPLYHPSWPQVSVNDNAQAYNFNDGPGINSALYTPSWPQVSHSSKAYNFNDGPGLNSPLYTPSWPQTS